jgi:hypothetical protein
MAIEVFNRYETKFLMDEDTYRRVTDALRTHMEPDPYNEGGRCYTISNIYYDTVDHHLIRTSLSKPKYKEKLRLRAYGVPACSDVVFLEIKKKVAGLVNKRRTAIRLSDAYRFVDTGKKPSIEEYMNRQVVEELSYFLRFYTLQPKVYLAYDRMAYFEKDNPDLRISFDTNIRTRRQALRLEEGDAGAPLLKKGLWLMEVKTSRAAPVWLADILAENRLYKTNFSKYGTEYKQCLESRRRALEHA